MMALRPTDRRPVSTAGTLVVAVLVLGTACTPSPAPPEQAPTLQLAGRTMGTTWSVLATLDGPVADADAAKVESAIEDALARVNDQMSTYQADSEISRFNASESLEPFPVSADLALVTAKAAELSKSSGGAFDPTVGPLVDLWGFGAAGRREEPPTPEELETARALVGCQNLEVTRDPPTLRKRIVGVRLDLSAIAKGYAVDVLSDLLSEAGYPNHLVEIGGEFRARGISPRGSAWRVGIQRPTTDAAGPIEPLTSVAVSDGGLATSGNYRNYNVIDGKRVTHTIDPTSGQSVTHDLASVSILAPDCMTADGYATGVMVLGTEKGLEWVERSDGVEALLLVHAGDGFREVRSSGWPAE